MLAGRNDSLATAAFALPVPVFYLVPPKRAASRTVCRFLRIKILLVGVSLLLDELHHTVFLVSTPFGVFFAKFFYRFDFSWVYFSCFACRRQDSTLEEMKRYTIGSPTVDQADGAVKPYL